MSKFVVRRRSGRRMTERNVIINIKMVRTRFIRFYKKDQIIKIK